MPTKKGALRRLLFSALHALWLIFRLFSWQKAIEHLGNEGFEDFSNKSLTSKMKKKLKAKYAVSFSPFPSSSFIILTLFPLLFPGNFLVSGFQRCYRGAL